MHACIHMYIYRFSFDPSRTLGRSTNSAFSLVVNRLSSSPAPSLPPPPHQRQASPRSGNTTTSSSSSSPKASSSPRAAAVSSSSSLRQAPPSSSSPRASRQPSSPRGGAALISSFLQSSSTAVANSEQPLPLPPMTTPAFSDVPSFLSSLGLSELTSIFTARSVSLRMWCVFSTYDHTYLPTYIHI